MADKSLFAPPSKQELELSKITSQIGASDDLFAPPTKEEIAEPMGAAEAGLIGLEKGAMLGLRPAIGGAAEAVGEGLGTFYYGDELPIKERIKGALSAGADAFTKGRKGLIEEQKKAAKDQPGISMASEIAGGLLVPIPAARGVMQAAKIGAAQGLGTAIGESEGLEDAAGKVASGAAISGGLGLLGKGISSLGRGVFKGGEALAEVPPIAARQDIGEVVAASKKLGIRPTAGMLTKSPVVQGLESSLEQSPSLAGAIVRRDVDKVRKGTEAAANALTDGQKFLSPFEAGEKVKSGIVASIGEKLDPIASTYQDLEKSIKFMDVSPKSLQRVAKNIENIAEVRIAPGGASFAGAAKGYADALTRVKTVDELKTLTSMVGKDLASAPDANTRKVLGKVYDKMKNLQENSMQRAAIATAPKGQGNAIAAQLVADLKGARKGYKEIMNELGDLADKGKLGSFKTPNDFINSLESIPSEKIGEKLFNTQNIEAIKFIQKRFPEEFETLKGLRLAQIVEKSKLKGELNPKALAKNLNQLGPEVQNVILGVEGKARLRDLTKVLDSMPGKIGASDTPRGLAFMEMINPILQVTEAGRYGLYKAMQKPGFQKQAGKVSGLIKGAGAATQLSGQALQKATPAITGGLLGE